MEVKLQNVIIQESSTDNHKLQLLDVLVTQHIETSHI